MSVKLFNSRDKKYKSIYGAMISGSTAVFRLLLPSDNYDAVSAARMVITSDDDGSKLCLNFSPTEETDGEGRYWELTLTAGAPGLYWYSFEYDTASGRTERIYRGEYATGYTNIAESSWQLTVYENLYTPANEFKGGIMYQIFPDRFYNSGEEKSGVPDDRILRPWDCVPEWRPDEFGKVRNNDYLGGDLKGIEEKLPYLKSLGVDMIYLNPIFEANSNHRYDPADYSKIDPLLGTEEDFVSLCDEAHKLGMKIILDGVFSHTGDDSVYFNKYGRYDSVGAYNSKESPYFDWYKFNNWPDDYTAWWGVKIQPEVIEENPDYTKFITGEGGIIEKWLKLGADGWRLDVADELPDTFIEAIRARIEKAKPGAMLLGEVWEDASNKTAYGYRRKYLLGKELHSVMNYPFKEAIISFLVYDDAEHFIDKILTVTENYPKEVVDVLMNPLGTHDTVRILTRLAGEDCEGKDRPWQSTYSPTPEQRERSIRLFKIAAAMQYTLPGFPSIYYGDEVGMEGCKDPFNRLGYPWGSDKINKDLLELHKKLGKIRLEHPILKDAEFVPISGAQGCVAYSREKDGKAVTVVANIAPSAIDYKLPEKYAKSRIILGNASLSDGILHIEAESFVILGI